MADFARTTARRTAAQELGDAAEAAVASRLEAGGWTVIGRHVRLGRAEIDLLAVDPGPPPALVVVEVRWRAGRDFGLPEETVGPAKRRRLRDLAGRLMGTERLTDGTPVPRLPIRIDVVAVEPGPSADRPSIRHHRDALA